MVIGIDIGGTKIRVGASTENGDVDCSVRFTTPRSYPHTLALILQAINRLTGGVSVEAIGVASPGPINPTAGLILNPKNLPWHNVNVVKDLSRPLKTRVVLGHDATLGGIAEARYGAGRSYQQVLYVTISTGIGTAWLIDGQPVPSQYNLEGGRQIIAQAHGQAYVYEDLASGAAIREHYGKIAAEIHDRGSWEEIAHWLAVGLFNLITMTQPEIVVLGGGVSVHYQRFIKPLNQHLASMPAAYPLPKVVQARYVETAPLIGAIRIARDTI